MKQENIKFYILIICSIIIYVTSFYSNHNNGAIAIIFMAIGVGKITDKTLSKISKILIVLMTLGFAYTTFLRNI